MERIRFGNTDLKVSKIALRGIPIMRLDKEDAVKVLIKVFKRRDLVLSSKSAAMDKKTFLSHLDLSLKRMSTDYIDIYHLHCINNDQDFEKVMEVFYDREEKSYSC